jgi:tRNA(Arg) A34 adenosine deaminase TadA
MRTPDELMLLAIEAARRGILAGQTPFGCAIEREGKLLAVCHNTVWLTTDITAHAEVNALREACRRAQSVLLEGSIVATTCEPCPMCMAALHWARVQTVYYGASIDSAAAAGFNELPIAAADIIRQGNSPVFLRQWDRAAECEELFQRWKETGAGQAY